MKYNIFFSIIFYGNWASYFLKFTMRIWQVCILSELLKGVQSITFPDIGPISGQNVTFLKKTWDLLNIFISFIF